MQLQSETSSTEQVKAENNEVAMLKYTLRWVASYMLLNGIILYFIPQFYLFDHLGLISLVTVLGIFTLVNVVAAIQIFRKKPLGLVLGIIGLIPFCFSISVKAFSYKLLGVLNFIISLNYGERGGFTFSFDFSFLVNSINAHVNVTGIGITINFVAIAALSFLIEAYLKQKKTGQFPIEGY